MYMQSSLLLSDTKKLIDKYTRFMTKDIYINREMNDQFLDGYQYLKVELEKNKYLYQDNMDYKNLFRIYEHSDELLKLHNQKYLKRAISSYESFFDGLYSRDILDKNKGMIILSNESRMLVVARKNYIPLIVGKIKYMHNYMHVPLKKVCILIHDKEDLEELKKELEIYELEDVNVSFMNELENSILKDGECVLDKDKLYKMCFEYIIYHLYSDKKRFREFYKTFGNDIYLNRDYKDFDTFKDYHCYLYKRMFLESGLSLRKYIERESRKRRGQLRTIDSVYVSCKEEVDVGNFLFLNCVDYRYDKDRKCFIISSHSREDVVSFCDLDSAIVLDKKGKYLESLVCELVKRQYGMERRDDDDIYQVLRDTTMDSYFNKFINEVMIPSIYYYQEKHSFDGRNFSDKQKNELSIIYEYYVEFMKKGHYVDEFEVHNRVQTFFDSSNYEYYVVLDDASFSFRKNYFIVLKNYPEVSLLKENVRVLYDYKKYLNQKKSLAVTDSFLSLEELDNLTNQFLRENLDYLNQKMEEYQGKICLCFYEEENKLKSYFNMVSMVCSVMEDGKGKKIGFGFGDRKEIKNMLTGGFFIKRSQDVLMGVNGLYDCFSLSKILNKYDIIVLPSLIPSIYHQRLGIFEEMYQVKIGLFMALSKCRDKVYLLCPNAKREEYLKMFHGFNQIEYISEK